MKRIRNFFKKVISFVLIIALFSTGCVFADSTESSWNSIKQDGSTSCPIPTLDYSGEISYVLKPNDNNGFSIAGDSEGISVSQYQLFDGIYSDGNNQFFQKVGAGEFVRVNRNVIKLKDPDLRTKLSDHFDNTEIINDIIKKAQMCSNSEAEVILFTEPGSERGYWTTTTWNGQTFHHYVVDIQ